MAAFPSLVPGVFDGEDDSDDEYFRLLILPTILAGTKCKHGGSQPGKRADKERKRAKRGELLMADYFGENPTYDEHDFRRWFRMRRYLFERIVDALVEDSKSNYFTQRSHATGLLGFLPEQKVTCALRMLAYGACADQLDELIRIGESTVLETMKNFCNAIMRIFGPEYLRKPTRFDLEMLLAENAARGFPGMIGSLDCMHWSWKNCPTAWAGAFKGKEKSKTVILEAVASQTLWIWHAFFGTPGSNNDLNVLERSPLLDDLVNNTAPIVHFRVNSAVYDRAYYLTDGIYPAWEIFQKSISEPNSQKDKKFKTVHEAIRKDIERAFGVLQQRFRILAVPCKLWSVNAMGEVVMTCIILHNMIIEDEIGDSTLNNNYLYEDGWVGPAPPAPHGTCPVTNIIQELLAVEDENSHFALKNDLIEHIWQMFGDSK